MGYYTDHTLTVRNVENNDAFINLQNALKQKEIINYALDDGIYYENIKEACFFCADSVKWYDHEKDMSYIAEQFPEMYFLLDGVGEEFGDLWHEYYHGSEYEFCRGEIVYEKPTKIKWPENSNASQPNG